MKTKIKICIIILFIISLIINLNIDNVVDYITKTNDTIDNYRVMYLVVEGYEMSIYNYNYTDNFYNLSFEYRHFLYEKEKLRNYLFIFSCILFFICYIIILFKLFIL